MAGHTKFIYKEIYRITNIMNYNCEICSYDTHDSSHFNRHKKSKKHLEKMSKLDSDNISSKPKVYQKLTGQNNAISKKSFECEFCEGTFSCKQSLSRHINHRCKSRSGISQLKKENNELKNKLNKIENEKEKILDLATTNAKVVNKSMNAMSYAMKNFNNAPPIGLLEDEEFYEISKLLMYDEKGKRKTERSIEEVIVFHHKQNTLHGILGDLIVRIYKKDNPKKQSAWSSDVARLTFIVKEMMGKSKKSKWVVDKKGIHFTETIIDPLMNKIKELLIDYNDECGATVRKISRKDVLNGMEENKIKSTLMTMQNINLTLLTIKLRKIHTEILKYVAPYFNLNVNNVSTISDESSTS